MSKKRKMCRDDTENVPESNVLFKLNPRITHCFKTREKKTTAELFKTWIMTVTHMVSTHMLACGCWHLAQSTGLPQCSFKQPLALVFFLSFCPLKPFLSERSIGQKWRPQASSTPDIYFFNWYFPLHLKENLRPHNLRFTNYLCPDEDMKNDECSNKPVGDDISH